MRLGKKSPVGMGPEWRWDYDSSLEHSGKHFYNIITGAELSTRQGQNVQQGKQTIEEALIKVYNPIAEVEAKPRLNLPFAPEEVTNYNVIEFNSLIGAIKYARLINNTSYIAAYGKVRKEYTADIGGFGYRAISTRNDANWYTHTANIQSIYQSYAEKFSYHPRNTFFVWERIS